MEIIKSGLQGVLLIKPQVFGDNRGYFFECFSQREIAAFIPNPNFVQHNESFSAQKGVIRGLHWQSPPYTQAKLVRVISGSIFDVVVDLRSDSPTFGRWQGFDLSGDNKHLLYIPRGFAHGFQTLTGNVIFHYLCDNYYHKASESGVIYNDPDVAVSWPLTQDPILSEKDKILPRWRDIKNSLSQSWNQNPKFSVPVSAV